MNTLSTIRETMKLVEGFRDRDWSRRAIIILLFIVELAILFIVIMLLFDQLDLFSRPQVFSVTGQLTEIGISNELAKNLLISLTIILLFLLVMILLEIKDWFCTSMIGYTWAVGRGLCDWDFQGNIVVKEDEKAIHIIQSDLGCIIKNRSWRNFDMSFQFKIPKRISYGPEPKENQLERGYGIVYRARQLGQYYMLKVDSNGYQPHVRNTLWENNGPVAEVTLSGSNLDKWVPAKLSVRDNILTASIRDDQFNFGIPSHSNIQRKVHAPEDYEKYKFESLPYAKISFCNAGTVGFRSAFLEEVYIKNLRITPEPFWQTLFRRVNNLLSSTFSRSKK